MERETDAMEKIRTRKSIYFYTIQRKADMTRQCQTAVIGETDATDYDHVAILW